MSAVAVPNFKPVQKLLTAEEFCDQYDGQNVELVRGIVEDVDMPKSAAHGSVCSNLSFEFNLWRQSHDIGRFFTNDTWIKTIRGPDSVRGPDIFYISYERQPKDSVGSEMITGTPELVVEVSSPSDVWSKSLAKVLEYLDSGVKVVLQVEPETRSVISYRIDEKPRTFTADQNLELSDILPGFSLPVSKLFA